MAARGSSQARGLCQSCSNATALTHCTHQGMDPSHCNRFLNPLHHSGTHSVPLKRHFESQLPLWPSQTPTPPPITHPRGLVSFLLPSSLHYLVTFFSVCHVLFTVPGPLCWPAPAWALVTQLPTANRDQGTKMRVKVVWRVAPPRRHILGQP